METIVEIGAQAVREKGNYSKSATEITQILIEALRIAAEQNTDFDSATIDAILGPPTGG